MADSVRRKLKILFAASEAVPFAKSGGLGDVAGSLPRALKHAGAKIENAIIDKANVVPAGTELRGTDGDILYLKKN